MYLKEIFASKMKSVIKIYLLFIIIYSLGIYFAIRYSQKRRLLRKHSLTEKELNHSYKSFKVFRLKNLSEDTVELLIQLVDGYNEQVQPEKKGMERNIVPVLFWSEFHVAGDPVDILVSPKSQKTFKQDLKRIGINKVKILFSDLSKLIEKQAIQPSSKLTSYNLTWSGFYNVSEFYKFFNQLEESYPDLIHVQDIGSTYENQRIVVVKVCNIFCSESKPTFWIDAGIHGNEWMGPATLSYVLKELVENSDDYFEMINNYQWFFLPIFNPDGYAITRRNDSFRLWQKNRSPIEENEECVGVDLNQNFMHTDFDANLNYPCSDIYQGNQEISQLEVKNVVEFLSNKNIRIFVSIHGFGNSLMLPWRCSEEINDKNGILKVANAGVDALNHVHGSSFRVSCVSSLASPDIAGSWIWAHQTGIPFAFALNLRDPDSEGVFTSPSQIIPSGQETFQFFKTLSEIVHDELT